MNITPIDENEYSFFNWYLFLSEHPDRKVWEELEKKLTPSKGFNVLGKFICVKSIVQYHSAELYL